MTQAVVQHLTPCKPIRTIVSLSQRDGEVVGTLQITVVMGMTRRGIKRCLLEDVHIRADQRGTGLGTIMVNWAIEQCRLADCGMVQLTSNKVRTDAHRFYVKLGFAQSHEGFKLML